MDAKPKKSKLRFVGDILVICALIFAGYYYRDHILEFINRQRRYFAPCSVPIKYNIGQFDKRFGITKAEFLANIQGGEKIWEDSIGKPLFEYSTTSPELTINLIYDYRQIATNKLQQLDEVISDSKNGPYKALNDKYNTLQSAYKIAKSELDQLIAKYQSDLVEYERQVKYWNGQGGAPKAEYAKLEAARQNLNAQNTIISQKTSELNQMGVQVNSTAEELNKLAKNLNVNIAKYNSFVDSTGKTFDEGRYIYDSEGQRINIYQFENDTKLFRVLTHELGHAIGLDHLENPKAMMYKLNEGENEELTLDDIEALRTHCRVK